MKNLSFKIKTTILITVITSILCAICMSIIGIAGFRAANSETQQKLVRAVERNVDEIEYKNGTLEIENDFAFYSNGVYCNVYSEDFNLLKGEIPENLSDPGEFENETVRKAKIDGENYYFYDSRLDFFKYEYEIDAFTGTILSCENDTVQTKTESAYKENNDISGGIGLDKATEIAIADAGISEDDIFSIATEYQHESKRDIYKVEFTLKETTLDSVWIRGIVLSNSSDVYLAVNRVILYLIPAFILVAALCAYMISKKTIGPVEKITRSAHEINSGNDLTRRIEIGEGNDEIYTLADTFNEMFARLQDSFESEKQFTSDASHELRTPLAVIKAECDFAMSPAADDEDKEEAFESISEQTDKMTHLVNELLILTRAEQSTEKFNFQNINLSELIESECQKFVPQKGISLTSDIEKDICLTVDVSLVGRMLDNLLSNAVKYGKENGKIKVSLIKADKQVILSVKDDGIGIKEEELPKIWSRFYRADTSRGEVEGFGLGLSLVKRIAALNNAEVEVKSVYGEGSEFLVKFFKN